MAPACSLALLLYLNAAPSSAQLESTPWRQVLSVPRIGGRLRSMAIDQRDPDRLFVGTEEGTLLRSTDRGITWDEIDLRSRVVMDRSLGLRVPGLPRLGATTKNNFRTIVDPPGRRVTDRISIPSVADPFPIKPDFFFAGFLATSPRGKFSLLFDAARSRFRETIPLRRIVICPGGLYELLVASSRDLYGSMDDGMTFVRLFANPGRTTIQDLNCNRNNPKQIAVATGIGLFLSQDSGLTFDQDLTAWPGQKATAVAFGPAPSSNGTRLYSASGSELFAGDPNSDEGLSSIYPNDPKTAPWLSIRWMATTPEGLVWLATDDGARVSFNHGKSWETAARTLLSRQAIKQVEIGERAGGGTRVAMAINHRPLSIKGRPVAGLHDALIYASDDGGKTFFPFFSGYSRRSYRRILASKAGPKAPAGWWVLTTGEVWTTLPQLGAGGRIDRAAVEWARSRLAKTPPMGRVLQEVLHRTGLSNERITALADRHNALNWIPRLDMSFKSSNAPFALSETQTPGLGGLPQAIIEGTGKNVVEIFVQASWSLNDIVKLNEAVSPVRNAMHELRRQISFAAEDAWHERINHLTTLTEGLTDPVQVEVLKTRVESLESMIAIWLGEDMSTL